MGLWNGGLSGSSSVAVGQWNYINGNESTDGSMRERHDSGDDSWVRQIRVSGTWNEVAREGA